MFLHPELLRLRSIHQSPPSKQQRLILYLLPSYNTSVSFNTSHEDQLMLMLTSSYAHSSQQLLIGFQNVGCISYKGPAQNIEDGTFTTARIGRRLKEVRSSGEPSEVGLGGSVVKISGLCCWRLGYRLVGSRNYSVITVSVPRAVEDKEEEKESNHSRISNQCRDYSSSGATP